MSIKINVPDVTELKPRITVIGVGGAGGNAINNMIASGLTGVDFIAANTDAQALAMSSADHRLQMGVNLTEGLGAGSHPEIGEAAALEVIEEIKGQISGSHMVFVACGMGGGTGTGAAPVIARIAREQDILTVGVVTKPFQFEGQRRMRAAEEGIKELEKNVDTLIVIPNQNLFRIATEKTTFADAFKLADQVLHAGIACITDLILKDGLINLDFADVRAIMNGMGTAMMGTGEALGERRALHAAEEAICNPLLDNITLNGAKGVLISITGGGDLTLYEVDEAASRVRHDVDPEANIIVGATYDDSLDGKVRVSIVASGVGKAEEKTVNFAPKADDYRNNSQQIKKETSSRDNSDRITRDEIRNENQEHLPEENNLDEDWQGPNDVTIEERIPHLRGASEQNSSDFSARKEDNQKNTGENFVPSPPINIKRQPRQMPSVEDFPEIGQRELRSKNRYNQENNAPDKKKRGIFERLARVGRATLSGDSDSDVGNDSYRRYEQAGSRETSSDNSDHNEKESKSVSRYNPLDDNRYARQSDKSKSSSNNEDNISEDIEIPAFLHREGK